MCDCDKTRLSADTTHLTYASVIIREPYVSRRRSDLSQIKNFS